MKINKSNMKIQNFFRQSECPKIYTFSLKIYLNQTILVREQKH